MKKIDPVIINKINDLRNDRLHGAGWLSREAISILNLAVKSSIAGTDSDFLDEIKTVTAEIMEARPSMISVSNYVSRLLQDIILISENQSQLDSIKTCAQIKANELLDLSEKAALKASEYGAEEIKGGDTIITCSYSSAICQSFKIAKEKGRTFQVIISKSKYNDNSYGEITAEQLRQEQIQVKEIDDRYIKKQAHKANKAIVGADSILIDGSLINGTPTLVLAQASFDAKIPLYTICETAKFDIKNYHNNHAKPEPGFDKIPPDLITGIITETGMIKPFQVINYQDF